MDLFGVNISPIPDFGKWPYTMLPGLSNATKKEASISSNNGQDMGLFNLGAIPIGIGAGTQALGQGFGNIGTGIGQGFGAIGQGIGSAEASVGIGIGRGLRIGLPLIAFGGLAYLVMRGTK